MTWRLLVFFKKSPFSSIDYTADCKTWLSEHRIQIVWQKITLSNFYFAFFFYRSIFFCTFLSENISICIYYKRVTSQKTTYRTDTLQRHVLLSFIYYLLSSSRMLHRPQHYEHSWFRFKCFDTSRVLNKIFMTLFLTFP